MLASASDDTNIILWDPFRYEKKLVIHTGHRGNIFSAKVYIYILFDKKYSYYDQSVDLFIKQFIDL